MSICLVMIVKNEAPVIERCLRSVLDILPDESHRLFGAMIVDTGSTDGTPEIVERIFPKSLRRRPWLNFAHNRTEAVNLAREQLGTSWLLMLDADHVLHGSIPADLTADAYYLEHRYAGSSYGLACLMKASLPWRYEGVVHEYLTLDAPHQIVDLPGPWVEVFHDGARSRDPETYAKDAKLLEAALEREPTNARTAFYLAQSLKDAGKLASALVAYKHRSMLAGWDEETWYARLEYARLTERTSASPETIQRAYLAAFNARPTRAEPLVDLARWHRLNGEFALAFLFARAACLIPRPADRLFVDAATYEWRALDEAVMNGWYSGQKEYGRQAAAKLLNAALPDDQRERIEANAKFYA